MQKMPWHGECRELRDRHPKTGRRDDVADADDPRPWCDGVGEPLHNRDGVVVGGGNRDRVDAHPVPARAILPPHASAFVLLIGDQHPITTRQTHGVSEAVHRLGRAAGDQDFVGGATQEIGREPTRAIGSHVRQAAAVGHVHRVRLQFMPRLQRPIQHRSRCRSERSRIQIGQSWRQEIVRRGRRLRLSRARGHRIPNPGFGRF